MAKANDTGSNTSNKDTSNKLNNIPDTSITSKQYDLFATLFSPTGDQSELSNLLALWDAIPKYHITHNQQKKLRKNNGQLPIVKKEFIHRGTECTVEITPALIHIGDSESSYFPSETEELVEDVLRKIFLDQNFGIHDPGKVKSWVKFSIRMIRNELKTLGKTRSADQIKTALSILNKTHIDVRVGKHKAYSGTIISGIAFTDREEYEASGGNSLCAAQFATPVSVAIESLDYRQYNYKAMMSLKMQLARWIYKRLSYHYINAGIGSPAFSLLYSDINHNSGLLSSPRKIDRFKQIRNALNQLIGSDEIQRYDEKITYHGNNQRIHDIKFQISPSRSFVSQMKAANKRQKVIRGK